MPVVDVVGALVSVVVVVAVVVGLVVGVVTPQLPNPPREYASVISVNVRATASQAATVEEMADPMQLMVA